MTGYRSLPLVAFDDRQLANPYPLYDELRTVDPVHWDANLNTWMLTRYEDVSAALRDVRLGSERVGSLTQFETLGLAEAVPVFRTISDMMLFSNPPKHTRLRALVQSAFTPRVVADLSTFIQDVVNLLIDRIERGFRAVDEGHMDGHPPSFRFDAIRDLAYPLPTAVSSALLGVSMQDSARFRKWWYDVMAFLKGAYTETELHQQAVEEIIQMTDFLHSVLQRVREAGGSVLLEALVHSQESDGRLSEDEIIANAMLLLSVGQESTTNLIGNGLLTLLRHVDQLEKLRQDPTLLASAIEECLRYESPVQFTGRRAVAELEIGGRNIAAGDYVLLFLGAANRDPDFFPEPDRFDIARGNNRHLAFGVGPHFCLGASLARLEGEIVFRTVLRRLPNLRLTTDPLQWRPTFSSRGLAALPVICEPDPDPNGKV